MTTRREFLASAGAVAAAGVLPLPITATYVAPASAAPVAPPMLAWAFDIRNGDYRATVIAATPEEAHAAMIAEQFDCDLHDDCPSRVYGNDAECELEDCCCQDVGMDKVYREPNLDAAAQRGSIEIEDYAKAGWGYVCDRCGGEPGGGDWQPIGGVAVCDDCITIEEWRAINPKYAAEREEQERLDAMTDEEYEREFGKTA